MKSRIGSLVIISLGTMLFYGGISGCGSKTPTVTTSAMSSEQKLLGKWLTVKVINGPPADAGETWEFSAGGKMNLFKTENNKQLTAPGTYKFEGSQQITVVLGGGKALFKFKFSFPADNQLFLEELDPKGAVLGSTTLSRVTEPSATK